MSPRKLYPGAVVAFWGPKWAHLPKQVLEPAIVIRVFDNGTFSCIGVDESGARGRAPAKIADYSAEPKSYHWCWPEEVADG